MLVRALDEGIATLMPFDQRYRVVEMIIAATEGALSQGEFVGDVGYDDPLDPIRKGREAVGKPSAAQ